MSYFNDEIDLSTCAKYFLSVGGRKAEISIPFICGIKNGMVINLFLCVFCSPGQSFCNHLASVVVRPSVCLSVCLSVRRTS
jgi:hypothetical protein